MLSAARAAVVLVLLALLSIGSVSPALYRGPGPGAGAVPPPGAPARAYIEAVLRVPPPTIAGPQLYDEAYARSAVEQAAAALQAIDPERLPRAFALMLQNAQRDLAAAGEMLRRSDFTEAVRLTSQPKAAARALQLVMEGENSFLDDIRARAEKRLGALAHKRQEQEAAARRLESTLTAVRPYMLLPSIEVQLGNALPQQIAAHWEAVRSTTDPLQRQRRAAAALGTLTLLEDEVERVNYLLGQLPPESAGPGTPVSRRLAAWAAREAESVLADVAGRQELYPTDTTWAYRALHDARSQAEAARQDLAAGWVARAWSLVISARADLESVPHLALVTSQPADQENPVAPDALARVRALALDEVLQTSELELPDSGQPVTELPWFGDRLRGAVGHLEDGDALLRRYLEDPASGPWREASREAYLQYVWAFADARRARLGHASLAEAGLE